MKLSTRLVFTGLVATSLLANVATSLPVDAAGEITAETRIAGETRYDTANALAVAAATARGPGNTTNIVIASGVKFPDGLSAAALAGATGAVMLLTPPAALPDSVIDTIEALRTQPGMLNTITTATIVGGEAAVSANVRSQLEALDLTVTRIQGDNRYQTANNVALEINRLGGIGTVDGLKTVFLATGEKFPDSLAASSWSYRNVTPVILTTGTALDPATRSTIETLGAQQVFVLGGTSVVSSDVETAVRSIPGVTTVRRLQGANRYETATAIATAIGEFDPDYVSRAMFVSATSFPDALAAAPLAGGTDSYAILPVGSILPTAVSTWLSANAATFFSILPIGGTTAVSSAVIDSALGRAPTIDPGAGFTSIFLGHSFFQPPAARFNDHALRAGFSAHEQTIVFGGGASGAAEALWNDSSRRNEALAVLTTGRVGLVGMTYHPEYPTLTGYRLWIDEALSHNPNTAFFVGMPWLLNPTTMTAAQYGTEWRRTYANTVVSIVRQLQEAYPTVPIFAIPYGRAAADLYALFAAGFLPDVKALVGDARTSLSRDDMGHAGQIVEELASLVWLRSIYCVDLTTYSYRFVYAADLKTLATAIVDEDDPSLKAPWCPAT